MASKPHIPEAVLVRIWEEQGFKPESLKTTNGLPTQVIRRGWRNHDSGPDFKNTLIRIGEHVYEGDVELHLEVTDWRAHGHDTDPSYNNTILHVVLWEPKKPHDADRNVGIRKADGDQVPTVVVQDCLVKPLEKLLEVFQRSDDRKQQKLFSCKKHLGNLLPEQILERLRELGKERLYQRAGRFEEWKEDSSPRYEQLLYEAICEGLGYSSNKRPFVELSRRLPLERIYAHLPQDSREKASDCLLWIQAMLFGISDLLPQPEEKGVQTSVCQSTDPETQEYITELRSLWEMLSPCLDAVPMKREDWHFFRLRPLNFPTRRIAVLSYLVLSYAVQPVFENYLRLFELFAEHLEQTSHHIRLLERTLEVPAAGYWKGRYLFGKPVFSSHDRVFLGKSRIRDMIISAIFPVLLLYARYAARPDLESQILTLYDMFPAPAQNRITKTISIQLFGSQKSSLPQMHTASVYQGMLHLHRHYCYLPACGSCPFGDK